MAIKCGNCKGSHDTIQAVRECYGAGDQPTERQQAFLRDLVSERTDHGITDIDALMKGMSREQASQLIENLKHKPRHEDVGESVGNPDISCEIPKHGTYTVVFEEGRRTIRIRRPHPKANFAVAEYLAGQDNTNSYRRLAREVKGGFKLMPSVKMRNGDVRSSLSVQALYALTGASEEELAEMGYSYALESGNCYRCGRKLTVPASIHRGMGPVCAGRS